MKRFITRASKSFTTVKQETPASPNPTTPHTIGLQPKYVVPPVPHPAPHTHLALLVGEEGLLIRPHIANQVSQTPTSYLRISWTRSVRIEELDGDGNESGLDWSGSVIVYGIVGVLELFSTSYLLVVTGKDEIGTLFEPTHAIYGVGGVTAIPLVYAKAKICLNTLASRLSITSRPSLLPTSTSDALTSVENSPSIPEEKASRVQFSDEDHIRLLTPTATPLTNTFDVNTDEMLHLRAPSPSCSDSSSTLSENETPASPITKALASRLSFWPRLSRRNTLFSPTSENSPESPPESTLSPKELDEMIQNAKADPGPVIDSIIQSTAPPPATAEEKSSELEDKIVRETVREFTRGGMYFAYNFDITRSLQHKQQQISKSHHKNALVADLLSRPIDIDEDIIPLGEPHPTLPLWRRVDKQFWWNEHLAAPFVEAGLHPYVLPIMQGYYQISSFVIPPNSEMQEDETFADYVIISRRSRNRAGLRYQRRGIDDEAHVANFVETETILRVKREDVSNIFCYTQIRGSIPLYWTQTGYGLKPPPLLSAEHPPDQQLNAMRRHFESIIPIYGPQSIVNLAEQNGKEGNVTTAYREGATKLEQADVMYNEYDFHKETKGMKYENISKLVATMERTFDHQGFLWLSGNKIMSEQKGVFRVNCIDCLDRTNVVQSAFARHVLHRQLGAIAILNPTVGGQSEMDNVFNDMWANNGDAISKSYAGTSALKGDFTRTGKRDLSGMLNDGVNSLARMYSSTFSDWFGQAVIDYMLGHRSLTVFSEFLLKLQSTDPRDLIRLSKIRAEAIATSVDRVLSEGERLLGGWTIFAPEQFNVKVGEKFEEKVLLLTKKALYIISYDYTLEKVKLYTRVPLGDIVSITKGAYILSPLEEASRDPEQNAGFSVTWLTNNQVTRLSSYSVRNTPILDGSQMGASAVSTSVAAAANRLTVTLSRARNTMTPISNLLSAASLTGTSDKTFAAFKMLPLDSGGGMLDGARSCREGVDLIVEAIQKACGDIGNVGSMGFIITEDVVSLAEAQRMTSVYAKMEYGVKRLLWLGG